MVSLPHRQGDSLDLPLARSHYFGKKRKTMTRSVRAYTLSLPIFFPSSSSSFFLLVKNQREKRVITQHLSLPGNFKGVCGSFCYANNKERKKGREKQGSLFPGCPTFQVVSTICAEVMLMILMMTMLNRERPVCCSACLFFVSNRSA